MIHVKDITIPIEEGEYIERILPSGITERYLINKVDCYNIPNNPNLSHYEIHVRKVTEQIEEKSSSIVYKINHVSGRVNINSNDNSFNQENTVDRKVFSDLKDVIKTQISINEGILLALQELENSCGTETYSDKYHSFIQSAANHISIIAPFIPALSTMA